MIIKILFYFSCCSVFTVNVFTQQPLPNQTNLEQTQKMVRENLVKEVDLIHKVVFKDVRFRFEMVDESRTLKSIGTYSESTNLNSSNHARGRNRYLLGKNIFNSGLKDLAIEM